MEPLPLLNHVYFVVLQGERVTKSFSSDDSKILWSILYGTKSSCIDGTFAFA